MKKTRIWPKCLLSLLLTISLALPLTPPVAASGQLSVMPPYVNNVFIPSTDPKCNFNSYPHTLKIYAETTSPEQWTDPTLGGRMAPSGQLAYFKYNPRFEWAQLQYPDFSKLSGKLPNGRILTGFSGGNPVFADGLSADYLPYYRMSTGQLFYQWYDGGWFYLGADRLNILKFAGPEASQYTPGNAPLERVDIVCREFDAVIGTFAKKREFKVDLTYINGIYIAAIDPHGNFNDKRFYTNSLDRLGISTSKVDAAVASANGALSPDGTLARVLWEGPHDTYKPVVDLLTVPQTFANSRTTLPSPDGVPRFADGMSMEYLPYYKTASGHVFYQWYDGSWFYLGKDHYNLAYYVPANDKGYTPGNSLPERIVAFCSGFDAVIDSFKFPAAVPDPALAPYGSVYSSAVKPTADASNKLPGKPTTLVTTPTTTPDPATTVTTAPGLMAHYKFEGNLKDATGKGHDGSEIGALAYASGGASGQALKLENGGYVKIPGASSLNLGEQFTLNAWVKLAAEENDVNRYNTVLFKEHPTEPGYFIYKAVASGTHDVRLDIQQLSTGFEPVVGTDGVGSLDLSSKWTMVTWVSDGDTLYVYVDGKLQTSATTGKKEYGTPFSDTVSSNLFIGGPKGASAELFNGQIDEVKLFSKALTGSEIKAEYDGVKGGGSHVLQLWIDQYRIVKDNQESAIDSAPVILNGRTMVPVRPVIEAMGGTVAYDPATRKIDLAFKGRTLTLWIDKYEAVVNGQTVTLEVAPTVINGRTMLPLRFAAESLGAGVEWDKTTQKITLKYQ